MEDALRPVRFDMAIRKSQAAHDAGRPDASAFVPPAPAHAIPIGPRPLWRRAARRLVGPITEHLRRYLSVPVARRLDVVDQRFDAVDHRISALGEQATRLERALVTLQRELDTAHGARQTALFAHIDRRIDGLAGLFGPRFDEIELKSRPLIDIDADTVAIRMGEGYVMAPKSQPLFVLMLADATTGGLEPGTRKVLKRLIEPGMRVADVGANVGLLTLVCARATGADGRVWSFEPEPGPRALAAKMKQANGLSWVTLEDCAIGREAGTLTFNVSPVIGHSSLYDLPADEMKQVTRIKVPVRPLDEAIGAGQRLDVVKIDVEGAELDVLAGMQGLLKANRDIALVVEYGPSHLDRVGVARKDWFKAFTAGGREAYAISEETGAVSACTAASLGDIESVNVVFVRKGGAAAARLGVA
jgi:FkbM family methyltransferase